MQKFTVSPSCNNLPVYKVLLKEFPNLSFSRMMKAFRKKDIKLNSAPAKKGDIVKTSDIITLYINFDNLSQNEFTDIPVAYSDENLLIVDKPRGMPTVSTPETNIISLHEILEKSYITLYPCHRLDLHTGGIIVFARNLQAQEAFNLLLSGNLVHKKYLCWCVGVPKEKSAVLTAYLVKNSAASQVKIFPKPVNSSLQIITGYKIKYTLYGSFSSASLLEVDLVTGRTHQIRAHMAYEGYPLIGDGKYCPNEISLNIKKDKVLLDQLKLFNVPTDHQALQAKSIEFKKNNTILGYLGGKIFKSKNLFYGEENE